MILEVCDVLWTFFTVSMKCEAVISSLIILYACMFKASVTGCYDKIDCITTSR